MSETFQLVVLVAAVCGALSYLLLRVIVPGAKLITKLVEMLPFLSKLPILETLEAHFETVEINAERNRAQAVEFARLNRESITELQGAIGALRELSRETRDQLVDVLRSGARIEASGVRAEESSARAEASGVRTEAGDAVVARELAATQRRADEVPDDEAPGAAADAASQSPDDSERP